MSLAWPGDGGSETSPILDTPGNNNSGFQDAGPTFSDLDADGTVEIVMAFSRGTGTNVFSGLAVYNAEDGSLAWDFLSDTRQGAGGQQKTPTIADLDLDGTMEIIIHNNVVDHPLVRLGPTRPIRDLARRLTRTMRCGVSRTSSVLERLE